MDLSYPVESEAFRAEVRAWLEANLPEGWGQPGFSMTSEERHAFNVNWPEKLFAGGWICAGWPKEYGGKGLSLIEQVVANEEFARLEAPLRADFFGDTLVGPTILQWGTEEQKQEFIPGILQGKIAWCQGFSEPNSGSDLASLGTTAVLDGDEWVINGQKVWTTQAQHADYVFLLCRTDPSAPQHSGISYLLVPMHQPGVEVRPIPLIAGSSPFCETFFTDARAEKKDLVGPLNGGWTIAKRLLQHERSGLTGAGGGLGSGGRSLEQLAKEYVGVDDKGRIADPDLRARLVTNAINMRAFQQTAVRAMMEAKGNSGPSNATSIMKNAGTQLIQERQEMTLEIMGHQGLGWEGDDFTAEELASVRGWLFGKAFTIFGGSQEVQSNIVSKRILGLPDLTQNH